MTQAELLSLAMVLYSTENPQVPFNRLSVMAQSQYIERALTIYEDRLPLLNRLTQ